MGRKVINYNAVLLVVAHEFKYDMWSCGSLGLTIKSLNEFDTSPSISNALLKFI